MKSPFEHLVEDFSNLDASNYVQIAVVLFAIAIGVAFSYFLSHRLRPEGPQEDRLRWVLFYSATYPLVTCIVLLLSRVIPGVDSGAGSLPMLAIPIFGSLFIIRAVARLLRSLFANSQPVRALINVLSVVVWCALVMHIVGVLPAVREELNAIQVPVGATNLSLAVLLQGLALVAVTLLGALWLSATLEKRLMNSSIDLNVRLVLSRLIRALLLVIALLVALSAVGIDLTVLSVFGGALGVGLGLGLQRIAANYVSGFAMLLERSFRVGDMIRLDNNFEGRITDINTRYTVVAGANGREAVVPNETFMVSRVEHLTLSKPDISISTQLQVDYDTDIELARRLMIEAALSQPRVLTQPAPSVTLSEFAADGITLSLSFWIRDPQNGQGGVRSDVNMAIWRAFRDNHVSIPFPQRVVRVMHENTQSSAGDINSRVSPESVSSASE